MVKSFIRESTVEDAVEVALNLRAADRDEIWASSLETPISCLMQAHRRSTFCRSIVVNDEVACMFGVVPASILGGVGIVWMLGTHVIDKHPVAFLRKCQKSVLTMNESYATLLNYVDARNTMSIHWLAWLGFHIFEAEPYGPLNMPFHRFELRK